MIDHTSIGLLILRFFIGIRVIYGVLDNVLSFSHMKEFAGFLSQFAFPFPMFSAILSVYVQLIASILILIGWKTRIAAAFLAFNFLIALIMVHFKSGDSLEALTPALAIFCIVLALIFTGAGKYAIDNRQITTHKTT
ncbi:MULTISPECIES: DoxX family protein [Sphingobacterium]|uniref:DoxX family protein n=1 Tax=Sphingobacterium TaxID=28453 RepID=UPI0011F0EE80|nr:MULTISPECIES: DoxX family protein [Sphingobacterium]